ncbi:MAG: glycerate kinase [Ignavibacteriaceae bacterium]|nr:glycerate kinase [Ignavibacteriaceae bacterium]
MKILIAPNAFKESLSAFEIADILQKRFNNIAPEYKYQNFPISDGGDGFVDVLAYNKRLAKSVFRTKLINGSEGNVEYLYDESEKVLFVESASVIGVKHIPVSERNVFDYDSSTLGAYLFNLLNRFKSEAKMPERIVIGVGGTATIDLGLGASAAFTGIEFDSPILKMNSFELMESIQNKAVMSCQVELVLDVVVPVLGTVDMLSEFGAQKALKWEQTPTLKKLLSELLSEIRLSSGRDYRGEYLGAGGGLAVGFDFLNPGAIITHSSDFIWNYLNLKSILPETDLVITSEGRLDRTSLLNKGTSVLLNKCREYGKSLIIICGSSDETIRRELEGGGITVFELKDYFEGSIMESVRRVGEGLQKCVDEIISGLK